MIPQLQAKMLESSECAEVGRFTYGWPKFLIFRSGGKVTIGSFCSIADGVTFVSGGEHFMDRATAYPLNLLFPDEGLPWHEQSRGPIVVGNDVWIGYGATILSGVTIGNGAVVGAGSVVTKSIPEYEVWAGNPARWIKARRNPGVAWWDWPLEKIKTEAHWLLQSVD